MAASGFSIDFAVLSLSLSLSVAKLLLSFSKFNQFESHILKDHTMFQTCQTVGHMLAKCWQRWQVVDQTVGQHFVEKYFQLFAETWTLER